MIYSRENMYKYCYLLLQTNSCLAQAIVPEIVDGKNSGIVEETAVAEIVLLQYCMRKRLYFFPGM